MRQQGWERILYEFIAARERMAFDWGKHDCCLFAADCVQAMTGIDHAAPFRGKYSTEGKAKALLKPYGGIIGYLIAIFGDCIPVSMARRGDVVAVETAHGTALGICTGAVSVHAGTHGLVRISTLEAISAWRIE